MVTIVDIGTVNRTELGHELNLLSKHDPGILGLDFFLVADSLNGDTSMVNALHRLNNTIQVVGLHNYFEMFQAWDSLEVSHPKFKVSGVGFANLPSVDSVLLLNTPMQQKWHDSTIHSFGYAVALAYSSSGSHRHEADSSVILDTRELGTNYNLITLKDLWSGNFDPELISDKIVLMGYLGDDDDFFYTDSLRSQKVNGVEVHAAVINRLLKSRNAAK